MLALLGALLLALLGALLLALLALYWIARSIVFRRRARTTSSPLILSTRTL